MAKRRYRTVAPIGNCDITFQAPFHLAENVTLEAVPDELRKDKHLQDLGKYHREWLDGCINCLTIHYETDALYSPDPHWKGDTPRTIEEANREIAYLANLAFWLQHPSSLTLWRLFHMPEFDTFIVQGSEGRSHFLCHPNDKDERVTPEDLDPTRDLFTALMKTPRETPVWAALRSLIAALQMNVEEIRYLLLWTALEALFGAPIEIKFRISQRIAFFVGKDTAEARTIFDETKKAYDFRSKVAHGAWRKNKDSTALTATSEVLLRRALTRLLRDDKLLNIFLSKDATRNDYLDELAFK